MQVTSNLIVLANPLLILYPLYSSSEHRLSFAIARPQEAVSAAKFSSGIKGKNVYFGLIYEFKGDLNYIHRSAYSGQAKEA